MKLWKWLDRITLDFFAPGNPTDPGYKPSAPDNSTLPPPVQTPKPPNVGTAAVMPIGQSNAPTPDFETFLALENAVQRGLISVNEARAQSGMTRLPEPGADTTTVLHVPATANEWVKGLLSEFPQTPEEPPLTKRKRQISLED